MKRSRVTMLAAGAAASLATLAAVVQLGAANPQAKLAEDVRRATYHDAALAEKAGYGAFLGCVNGPQEGAMGVHYVNGDYVNDDVLDPQKPEALMYELKDGKLRLLRSCTTPGVPTATASRLLRPPRVGVAHQPERRLRGLEHKVSCDDFMGIATTKP